MPLCKRCQRDKDSGDFYLVRGKWLQQPCKQCISERRMEPGRREAAIQYSKEYRRKLRERTFDAYGGRMCSCCGTDIWEFLVLDHVDGGGRKHRKSISRTAQVQGSNPTQVFRDLEKKGFPPGYRVLCHNCNVGFAICGVCPHQRED